MVSLSDIIYKEIMEGKWEELLVPKNGVQCSLWSPVLLHFYGFLLKDHHFAAPSRKSNQINSLQIIAHKLDIQTFPFLQ